MEILSPEKSLEFFVKLLPYSLHPNLSIRNEFFNFVDCLLKCYSPEETFAFLYEYFCQYSYVPSVDSNITSIKNYYKHNLPRVIYQLELEDISYDTLCNYEHLDSLSLIKTAIQRE